MVSEGKGSVLSFVGIYREPNLKLNLNASSQRTLPKAHAKCMAIIALLHACLPPALPVTPPPTRALASAGQWLLPVFHPLPLEGFLAHK